MANSEKSNHGEVDKKTKIGIKPLTDKDVGAAVDRLGPLEQLVMCVLAATDGARCGHPCTLPALLRAMWLLEGMFGRRLMDHCAQELMNSGLIEHDHGGQS